MQEAVIPSTLPTFRERYNRKLEIKQFVDRINHPNRKDAADFLYEKMLEKKHPRYYDLLNSVIRSEYVLRHLDCTKFQNIIDSPEQEVVGIGDFHGDFCAAFMAFMCARIIKRHSIIPQDSDFSNITWNPDYKDRIVVIVGDLIDSNRFAAVNFPEDQKYCQSYLKIIQLINHLNTTNKKNRGRIFCIYGNHEFMNVEGSYNFLNDESKDKVRLNAYLSDVERTELLEMFVKDDIADLLKIGELSYFMACTNYVGPLFIANGILFLHAGLSNYFLEIITSCQEIPLKHIVTIVNDITRKYHLGYALTDPEFRIYQSLFSGYKHNIDKIDYEQNPKEYYDSLSLTTTRIWQPEFYTPQFVCEQFEKKLDSIHTIIKGHTPTPPITKGMSCRGKNIFDIDVAMSYAFGNRQNFQTNVQSITYYQPQSRFILSVLQQTDFEYKEYIWNESENRFFELNHTLILMPENKTIHSSDLGDISILKDSSRQLSVSIENIESNKIKIVNLSEQNQKYHRKTSGDKTKIFIRQPKKSTIIDLGLQILDWKYYIDDENYITKF